MQTERKIPVACFAPPLTDAMLESYHGIIADLPVGPVKTAMEYCLECVLAWWKIPESKEKPKEKWETDKHRFEIVPLQKDHIALLDESTPWDFECQAMAMLFGTLPHGKGPEIPATATTPAHSDIVDQKAYDLYTAAHTLLWYAMEITRDREPLSQDKLQPK